MEKSRLEALSDDVFALVVTLLILDIRFPFKLKTAYIS
ncbi:MAG: DUF1211 domain-containing protein [Anaerolineales bacterium]|nr:DUF1211 domain-containing protein [Anaerolineales bacterium]